MILTCTIKLRLEIFNNIQSDNISDENVKKYTFIDSMLDLFSLVDLFGYPKISMFCRKTLA